MNARMRSAAKTVQIDRRERQIRRVCASQNSVKTRLDEISFSTIGAAIEVHRTLGPGLLESAYEACLFDELISKGLRVERQKPIPLIHRNKAMGTGYRADLLVEQMLVVEVKAIEKIEPVHIAQVISYLRLSQCKVGLLMNFNVKWLSAQGIRRIVNDFPD